MQTLPAIAVLVAVTWCVVLPTFALLFIKPNDRYYEIWVNGVTLIGAIACVVGGVIAGAWALDTLGIIDSPRF